MPRTVNYLSLLLCTALLGASTVACSNKSDASTPKGGGPARGRTTTLSATDIDSARIVSITDGVAVTGNLRPIETIDVRARLDGELSRVYVREGDRVRTGQLLASFEASEEESSAESALADRASARLELSTAQWNLDQTEELFKVGAVPERELRAAQQAVAAARAKVAAADAKVRVASNTRSDTRVVSPTSGIVAARQIEPGEHVTRGTPLLTVVRSDFLELTAAVPEKRASTIVEGQRVEFNAAGRQLTGRVSRVNPVIDPTNRSITVYVQVPNSTGEIKGGTFATGTIISRSIGNALVIPAAAVRYPESGSSRGNPFVYKLNGRVVDQVNIGTGVTDDRLGLVEVTSGLAAGDEVITGNVGVLSKGTQVEILGGDRSARNANTGASGAPRSQGAR